jgi:hypothetical protein
MVSARFAGRSRRQQAGGGEDLAAEVAPVLVPLAAGVVRHAEVCGGVGGPGIAAIFERHLCQRGNGDQYQDEDPHEQYYWTPRPPGGIPDAWLFTPTSTDV